MKANLGVALAIAACGCAGGAPEPDRLEADGLAAETRERHERTIAHCRETLVQLGERVPLLIHPDDLALVRRHRSALEDLDLVRD